MKQQNIESKEVHNIKEIAPWQKSHATSGAKNALPSYLRSSIYVVDN